MALGKLSAGTARKLLLVFLGFFLSFVLAEIVFRSLDFSPGIYRYDESTGLNTLKPDRRFYNIRDCFKNLVKINSSGFHDSKFREKKAANVFRIVVLGDSFVESLQVPIEKTFHKVLEKKLNSRPGRHNKADPQALPILNDQGRVDFPASVANFPSPEVRSRPGQSAFMRIASRSAFFTWLYPRYQTARLKVYYLVRGIKAAPGNNQNEAARIGGSADGKKSGKEIEIAATPQPGDREGDKKRDTGLDRVPVDEQVYLDRYPPLWNDAWQTERELLCEIRALSEKVGARFLLVSLAESTRITRQSRGPGLDYDKPERVLTKICGEHDISYLPLLPVFRERFKGENKAASFPCDGHWNETGHQWAGEAIFEFLESHPSLIGK
ncbi:MAG: SGNH/GDSL hydrolase family protein [Armatimonadetes bacterium]|nr:SGNH/GDSL hydrolase family protein [Armatimonadota bacterium]